MEKKRKGLGLGLGFQSNLPGFAAGMGKNAGFVVLRVGSQRWQEVANKGTVGARGELCLMA